MTVKNTCIALALSVFALLGSFPAVANPGGGTGGSPQMAQAVCETMVRKDVDARAAELGYGTLFEVKGSTLAQFNIETNNALEVGIDTLVAYFNPLRGENVMIVEFKDDCAMAPAYPVAVQLFENLLNEARKKTASQ